MGKRSPNRKPWLIQIRLLADKGCTVQQLKNELKGTGVEVDTTYPPKRVSPALFVGRGFATQRAVNLIQRGEWVACEPRGSRRSRRPPRHGITFFDEVRFDDPPPALDYAWGADATREMEREARIGRGRRTNPPALEGPA